MLIMADKKVGVTPNNVFCNFLIVKTKTFMSIDVLANAKVLLLSDS